MANEVWDASIKKVNYVEEIPAAVTAIRTAGNTFVTEIKKVYTEINSMKECWTGKRYNGLIVAFNGATEGATGSGFTMEGTTSPRQVFNDMFQFLDIDLPVALDIAGFNYATADGAAYSKHAEDNEYTGGDALDELVASDENELKFLAGDVSAHKTNIETSFETAITALDEVKNNYMSEGTSLTAWNSTSGELYYNKFKEMDTKVRETIAALKTAFTTAMTQVNTDFSTAESNTGENLAQ